MAQKPHSLRDFLVGWVAR
jgi:hypothetical protein